MATLKGEIDDLNPNTDIVVIKDWNEALARTSTLQKDI
jgi:hypothetical protein